ncbi:hypothetical protein G9A89_013692 [Geosiphon pyriformis]|nr:hypothetical protein G9A89_013692 [Geosiphon pyriformis]
MNCSQYLSGMTMTKKREKKRKNLSGTLTKSEKSTMIKKIYQSGSDQSHHIFLSSAKTATRNCPQWELGLHQMKTTGCAPITIANYVTTNATGTPRDKTNETMNHVLLVENNCLTKRCGITFLVEEESVMLHASTQSLLVTGDNKEGIMLECVHDTDARFDLKYSRKDAIKLEPHSHTCINLKIALKIPATTMVQLASRSSLAKREIIIRGKIIDAGYVKNIMAMLQNNSEKTYIIEPNEKIIQAIFLPLVRIAQLIPVGKKEELEITAREIQGFGFINRIDVPVNMAEKKIIGQEEIISTDQVISIPPYDQYMVVIERKVKDKDQIFEAETSLCELEEIGLINLYIPAKSHNHIKIPIYNTTENAITIPEEIIIGYISTELENQPPSIISDFP